MAAEHGILLKDLLQLDPFVTKSLLVSALLGYTFTLGLAITGEEWHRSGAYNLRQALSNIRMKAVRVKTGERQPVVVKDLVRTFQGRRLLRRKSNDPQAPLAGRSVGSGSEYMPTPAAAGAAAAGDSQQSNPPASPPTTTKGLPLRGRCGPCVGTRAKQRKLWTCAPVARRR